MSTRTETVWGDILGRGQGLVLPSHILGQALGEPAVAQVEKCLKEICSVFRREAQRRTDKQKVMPQLQQQLLSYPQTPGRQDHPRGLGVFPAGLRAVFLTTHTDCGPTGFWP